VDINFKGRHTDVQERFRKHAIGKLAKIEKLDAKVIRIDVEICAERNPRQSGRKERVELTISSRGPVIRAEAAAEDRYAALDMAVAKLESRLRRAGDRRKCRHAAHAGPRTAPDDTAARRAGSRPSPQPADVPMPRDGEPDDVDAAAWGAPASGPVGDDIVPIEMEGDGPLVVREKFHVARPMGIDQALFEMELVGHDFFLFRDLHDGCPSVVYRRQGYQYGVIRLVEEDAEPAGQPPAPAAALGRTNGQARSGAQVAAG
jgi:ribosomal subunit interface protein